MMVSICWYEIEFNLTSFCSLQQTDEWARFYFVMEFAFAGYCINMLPYFCMERTLFLHHYMPALLFKIILLTGLTEHLQYLAR